MLTESNHCPQVDVASWYFQFSKLVFVEKLCIFIFRITRRWRHENITNDKSAYFQLIAWYSSARSYKTQHSNLCYLCIQGLQWKKESSNGKQPTLYENERFMHKLIDQLKGLLLSLFGSYESRLTPILFPFVQTYSICLKIYFTFLRGARWQREIDGQNVL